MGWRFRVGSTRACKCEDGFIVVDNIPSPLKYPTKLKTNTDWQCNLFDGTNVCFVLIGEDRVFIGLENGSILIVTLDGVWAGLTSWEPPYSTEFYQVGYIDEISGVYPAYVKRDELYFIHMGRKTLKLDSPVSQDFIEQEREDSGLNAKSLSTVLSGRSIAAADGSVLSFDASSGEWLEDSFTSPRLKLGG